MQVARREGLSRSAWLGEGEGPSSLPQGASPHPCHQSGLGVAPRDFEMRKEMG